MLYRYNLTPQSPVITPLMSDTFFGHFCWAIRYQHGEQRLIDFLNAYGNDKPAPVLFSSGFVSGHIPRPSLPSLPRQKIYEFVENHFGKEKEERFFGLKSIKKWNKQRSISLDMWQELKNNYSDIGLYEKLFKNEFLPRSENEVLKHIKKEKPKDFIHDITSSNVILRTTGRVPEEGGGGLFTREKTWFRNDLKQDLYVEIQQADLKPLVDWFLTNYLPQNGFGADKSVGMGYFIIKQDDTFNPDDLMVQNPDARLSLCMTAFSDIQKYPAYYRLKTKFGKLGGNFAFSSPSGGNPKPFKKPILMYEPGAVFLSKECRNEVLAKSLISQGLLENVHSDNNIRHCGIPITLPFKLSEEYPYEFTAA